MKSKLIKGILSIISTIILGALGSALWEVALHPFLSVSVNFFMDLYGKYSDNVYRYVSTGGNYLSTVSAAYFFMILILLLSLGPTRARKYFDNLTSSFPLKIMFFIVFTYVLLSRTYYDSTARTTLRDIEIIAPYITESEYKQLRSDFYSMDNRADYITLRSTIDQIMESEGLSE